ncbi:MAG TPA: helicase-related protein [Polyangiaceae bacterium]|nr:helicase-related protein [Polyangiaceae bacterium]
MSELPVYALRPEFERRRPERRLVLSSPTGSGKSTEVPRWFGGRVAVVEPRRVACRALAQRVAELEGAALGGEVGYRVRDENRAGEASRIVFATPGIVLRAFDEFCRFDAVVLDEFHERGLEVDLLLGLLLARYEGRLLVMSATLDGDRVAAHVGGPHLRAEGRAHPVAVRHVPGDDLLPDPRGLEARLGRALDLSRDDPGDVLVFLPGKGEIADAARWLGGRGDLSVVPLHGDLSLDEQRRAFAPASRRKVIVATNVAETSLTIPGVGVVIDSGLVRQTRYHQGRGHLTLVPIAQDSADQRAGRAGRTGPGVAYRLWAQAAKLAPATPPEVHRESLVPLVLGAAACGLDAAALPLLDRPKDHALAAATDELRALGALDEAGAITPRGVELFGLPLDAPLGRLIVEARRSGGLEDAIDLAAALSVGRPLFVPGQAAADDEPGAPDCDATALVRALRAGDPGGGALSRFALESARQASARLRRAHGLPERPEPDAPFDRERLARAALAADPRCAHVARPRGSALLYSNGGTELELGRESRVRRAREAPPAIAVLATRAVGLGRGETAVYVTCATPLTLGALVEAGLGRDRLAETRVEGGRVVARVERVYARRVLATRDEVPRGEVAREALAALLVRGSVFRASVDLTRERLAAAALWAALAPIADGAPPGAPAAVPTVEQWAAERVAALGFESGDDFALLSPGDFEAPDLPADVRAWLDRDFPRSVRVGDATYEADYDAAARRVVLRKVRGARRDPPPPALLPRFPGLRVVVDGRTLR